MKNFRLSQRKKIEEIQNRKLKELSEKIKKENRENLVKLILDKDKPRPKSTRKVVVLWH